MDEVALLVRVVEVDDQPGEEVALLVTQDDALAGDQLGSAGDLGAPHEGSSVAALDAGQPDVEQFHVGSPIPARTRRAAPQAQRLSGSLDTPRIGQNGA